MDALWARQQAQALLQAAASAGVLGRHPPQPPDACPAPVEAAHGASGSTCLPKLPLLPAAAPLSLPKVAATPQGWPMAPPPAAASPPLPVCPLAAPHSSCEHLLLQPPLPLPQQSPVTPAARQPVPTAQVQPTAAAIAQLTPQQQQAALSLLQQLLAPTLTGLPAQQHWQAPAEPSSSSSGGGSSNRQAAPRHLQAAPAEAEAAAAAITVMALAAEPPSPTAAAQHPTSSFSDASAAPPPAQPFAASAPPPPPQPLLAGEQGGPVEAPPRDDAPLAFEPRATRSVFVALDTPLPRGHAVRGARDQAGVWQAWIHYNKKQAFVGRLGRQQAAVAADLVLTWQRYCLTSKVAEKAATRQYNLPDAGYEVDDELVQQLRRVGSAEQMKTFVQAVVPQAAPHTAPPGSVRPQGPQQQPRGKQRKRGGGSASGGGGSHKRRALHGQQEAQQALLAAVAGQLGAPPQALPQHDALQLHRVQHKGRKQAAPRRAVLPDSPTASAGAAAAAAAAAGGTLLATVWEGSTEPGAKRRRSASDGHSLE